MDKCEHEFDDDCACRLCGTIGHCYVPCPECGGVGGDYADEYSHHDPDNWCVRCMGSGKECGRCGCHS